MKRIVLNRILLSILVVTILSFGLGGCLDIVIPVPEETGTVQIEITNDIWDYDVYMDGNDSSGTYLGRTNNSGEGTFYDIPTGYRSFYVISTDGYYDGWAYETIDTGNNLVEIATYSTGKANERDRRISIQ